jgi:hypothetical protein
LTHTGPVSTARNKDGSLDVMIQGKDGDDPDLPAGRADGS